MTLKIIADTASEKYNGEILRMQSNHASEIESLITKHSLLLSIIAHDIKTPIGSIIGFLSHIKDTLHETDKPKIEENITIALQSANRTLRMFDDLLEWAMASESIKLINKEEILLQSIIEEEIKNIAVSTLHKKINISYTDQINKTVFVDKNMIRSVIRNLLQNAFKYSFENSEIKIRSKIKNGFIETSIKDSGTGISKDLKNKIFTTAGYNSRIGTNNEVGTGLGLLLCKEFIDKNNGKIWVISEPGEGSEFKFTLPLFLSQKLLAKQALEKQQ